MSMLIPEYVHDTLHKIKPAFINRPSRVQGTPVVKAGSLCRGTTADLLANSPRMVKRERPSRTRIAAVLGPVASTGVPTDGREFYNKSDPS